MKRERKRTARGRHHKAALDLATLQSDWLGPRPEF